MSATALDILKDAILLESRGMAFYKTAAEQAGDDTVRQFFERMADEEKDHVELLGAQFRLASEGKGFTPPEFPKSDDTAAAQVLNADVRGKISAAGFEAAAISAAIAMEERAVKLYNERAAAAGDPEEKKLYQWLADWEKTHLEALSRLDRELTEDIWNDAGFWPF